MGVRQRPVILAIAGNGRGRIALSRAAGPRTLSDAGRPIADACLINAPRT
jgi:hypothetical protein